MTTKIKITLALLTLVALVAFLPQSASATKAMAQQENLECTSCHDKPGSKLLTDRGLYYELMGSFDGYAQLQGKFERCTSCHSKKPGSKKLTETGEKYKFVADDMEGLRTWLMEQHPRPAEKKQEQQPDSD